MSIQDYTLETIQRIKTAYDGVSQAERKKFWYWTHTNDERGITLSKSGKMPFDWSMIEYKNLLPENAEIVLRSWDRWKGLTGQSTQPSGPPTSAPDDPWSDDRWKSGIDKWLKGESLIESKTLQNYLDWWDDCTPDEKRKVIEEYVDRAMADGLFSGTRQNLIALRLDDPDWFRRWFGGHYKTALDKRWVDIMVSVLDKAMSGIPSPTPSTPPPADDPWSDDKWQSGKDKWLKGESLAAWLLDA